MGKEVFAGRAYGWEIRAFEGRVDALKPKRTISERLRELMNADVKKWAKRKGRK